MWSGGALALTLSFGWSQNQSLVADRRKRTCMGPEYLMPNIWLPQARILVLPFDCDWNQRPPVVALVQDSCCHHVTSFFLLMYPWEILFEHRSLLGSPLPFSFGSLPNSFHTAFHPHVCSFFRWLRRKEELFKYFSNFNFQQEGKKYIVRKK